jgi:Ca-activated chloride channel homolog
MRFANPWWFLLLLPIVGLAVVWWFRARKPNGIRFPELQGIGQSVRKPILGPDEIVGLLTMLGLCLLVVAMARPQFGLKTEQISGKGVDIVLCLDTSGSMRSVDFKPQNRLGAAKEVALKFIENRTRDRIGLVVFGGTSMTVCPLTSDKRALQEYMKHVAIDMTEVNGTAVGMAIATAADRLRESDASSRVILLLTDGRNNMGQIDPVTAAKAAAALGIKIYAVGAGSPEGGLMPVKHPVYGTRMVPMKNDLDETTLRRVANSTNGMYFRAKDLKGLARIFEKIDRLEKSDYKIVEFTNYRDLYFGWLLFGFALLGCGMFLQQTLFRRIP